MLIHQTSVHSSTEHVVLDIWNPYQLRLTTITCLHTKLMRSAVPTTRAVPRKVYTHPLCTRAPSLVVQFTSLRLGSHYALCRLPITQEPFW